MDEIIRGVIGAIGLGLFAGFISLIAHLIGMFRSRPKNKIEIEPDIELEPQPIPPPIQRGRTTHCWNCSKQSLSESSSTKCSSCCWIICACGACKSPKYGGCSEFKDRKLNTSRTPNRKVMMGYSAVEYHDMESSSPPANVPQPELDPETYDDGEILADYEGYYHKYDDGEESSSLEADRENYERDESNDRGTEFEDIINDAYRDDY